MMDINLVYKIVDGIIRDLTDRRGLRQEWEQIDDGVRDEIRERWIAIVLECLG